MPRIQYRAITFTPLVVAVSLDVAAGVQGGAPPASPRTIQYQALTGPVLVPAAAETVTLDQWASQPPGRPRLAWRPTGGIVAPVDTPAVAADPDLSWQPSLADVVRRPRVVAGGTSAPIDPPPAVVVPDFWLPLLPVRVMERDGPTIQYAPLTGPVSVVSETEWLRQAPDPVRRRHVVLGNVVAPVDTPAAPAGAPDRAWAPSYPDPVRRPRPRPLGALVAPVDTPAPPAPAPALSWAPVTHPYFRAVTRPTGGVVAPVDLPPPDPPPLEALGLGDLTTEFSQWLETVNPDVTTNIRDRLAEHYDAPQPEDNSTLVSRFHDERG